MTESIRLIDEQKRAAEGGEQALNELMAENDKFPVPDNRQSRG